MELECLAKVHKSDRELKKVKLTTSNWLKGRRVWVTLPEYPEPIIGFYSYDRKGVVYQKPNSMYYAPWFFIRIFKSVPMIQGGLSTNKGIGFRSRFDFCIYKAVLIENQVCHDLYNAGFPEYDIIHLPESGIKSGGTDIVIGWKNGFRNTKMPKKVVDKGMLAIEVLGICYNYGNIPKFTYHCSKDFKAWIRECYRFNTIPVIAWVEDGKPWYMVMNQDYKELEEVFYTRYNAHIYGYRQRKGLTPVRLADKYRLDNKTLYELYRE